MADDATQFPDYTPSERLADLCVHVAGVGFGVVAVTALFVEALPQQGPLVVASLAIYAVGLLAMLVFSALYNLTREPGRKALFRRFDHAAIFVMIAGTYTPFVLVRLGGGWGIGLLFFVWLGALGGVVLKLAYPNRLERLSLGFYLLLGWVAMIGIKPLLAALPVYALVLLGVGGAFYSIGVLFHLSHRLPYHNAIWHAFVLVAAVCHYAAVFGAVALPLA